MMRSHPRTLIVKSVADPFTNRLIATAISVQLSMHFQWDFRLVVDSVPGVEDGSGVLGGYLFISAVWGKQHQNLLLHHLNRHLWLCLVSPDCLAVRLIALGVVNVASPSEISSCIGAPKQLRIQQPVIVSSWCVESALATFAERAI